MDCDRRPATPPPYPHMDASYYHDDTDSTSTSSSPGPGPTPTLFDPFFFSETLPTPAVAGVSLPLAVPPSPAPTPQNIANTPNAPDRHMEARRDAKASGSLLSTKVITLDEIERDILRQHAHLPTETKRRMVKAEFKRLKHCETVRQSRVRKKAERKDLKKENADLETELNQALVAYRQTHDWMQFDEDSWWDVTFKRFVHSIYEVRALRRENGELKDQLMFYDTIGEQLERLQEDFQIPSYLERRLTVGQIHFQPLSEEQARAIMLDSHAQAISFFKRMKCVSSSAQEKTNGWTQFQGVNNGHVQFNFTKRITTINADDLVQKSWEMYCDMELYRGIYANVQRLEILQTINEDTLVFRRDLQDTSESPIFRTIFLLFRIRIENGYVICFRSNNPPVYADDDDGPNVQWMEMFYWLMVLDIPATPGQPRPVGCDVSFGGNLLNARSIRHATVWKYQIAMSLLRWESNAVAPIFAMLGQ